MLLRGIQAPMHLCKVRGVVPGDFAVEFAISARKPLLQAAPEWPGLFSRSNSIVVDSLRILSPEYTFNFASPDAGNHLSSDISK